MALVILGMAAAGVLLPFSSGAAVQAEGLRVTLAAKLANDLMERIVATPFNDIVGKYNYPEPLGQVKDASGIPFTDSMYDNFSREVTCKCDPEQEFFILVTVQVYYQGRPVATLRRLISR